MNINTIWNKFDELTLVQAVFLFLGYNPTDLTYDNIFYMGNRANRGKFNNLYFDLPENFELIINLIKDGVVSRNIKAQIICSYNGNENDFYENPTSENQINWQVTKIMVSSFKDWLRSKDLLKKTFFDSEISIDNFADKNNPFYAPKLNAALQAWQAISQNPELLKKVSVKQALKRWLSENADKFGLRLENGKLNNSAIMEIAKVANWKPEGGATPTNIQIETNLIYKNEKNALKLKTLTSKRDLDEIPF